MSAGTVTKEGVTVKAGQVWRDLDRRMGERKAEVVFVDEPAGKAHMIVGHAGGRVTKVAISRMHKGATGWALVSEPAAVRAQTLTSKPDVSAMVNRFLGWPLPKTFSPDCGISFDGRKDDELNKNKTWPVGTNLLTADEAKAMFEYCLGGAA